MADRKVINLEDLYEVKAVDKDGNYFDRGTPLQMSRFDCHGENHDLDLSIDLNVELIKLKVGDRFTMMLVDSLDGKPDDGVYQPQRSGTLLDKFEYAMSGRVFKKFAQKDKTVVIASFGGLLMKLEADARSLKDIELDAHIYALIRKAATSKS